MKREIILSVAIFLAACSAVFAQEINRYELNVGDFNRLVVDDGINVEYTCSEDSAGIAVYECTPKMADQLIFDFSKKGRLLIQKQYDEHGAMQSEELPIVRVSSKFLSRVQNNGDSTVVIHSVAPCSEFKATVVGNGRLVVKDIKAGKVSGAVKTGNGQLIISGGCDDAVFSNTGVGSIQADNLEAQIVSCRFFGTGTTGVWPVKRLSIKGMFPGKLYYKGTPDKIKNYSMGVKVFHIDPEGKIIEESTQKKSSNDSEESED